MSTTISVTEFNAEGIAIIEDTQGKYIASKYNDSMIPLPDLSRYYTKKSPGSLLQSRSAMMT